MHLINANQLNEINMQMWPTPTSGSVNVKLNGVRLDQNFIIQVFSMNGQLMSSENLRLNNNEEGQFNMSALSKGTYIVHLTDGNVFFSEKVILQ